jgi:hypothetical protein
VTYYRLREVVDGAFLADPSDDPSSLSMGLFKEEVSSSLVELHKYDAEVEQETLPGLIDFTLEYPLSEYGYELLEGDNRVVKAVRMIFEITIRFDGATITPEDFAKSLTLEYYYGTADFDFIDYVEVSREESFIEDDDL